MKKVYTSNRIGMTAPAICLYAHSGGRSATTRNGLNANASVLEDLSAALSQVTAAKHPRTFKLLQSGRSKLGRKLIEEACEVTVEVVKRDPAGVVRESADLLYHLVVLWFHMGIEPLQVWQEMQTRANLVGIAEKLPKTPGFENAADEFDH